MSPKCIEVMCHVLALHEDDDDFHLHSRELGGELPSSELAGTRSISIPITRHQHAGMPPKKPPPPTAAEKAKAAKQKERRKEKAQKMRRLMGELDPQVRKFIGDLLEHTYPSYEYTPKNIPITGNI